MDKQVAEMIIGDLGRQVLSLREQIASLKRSNTALREQRFRLKQAIKESDTNEAAPMTPSLFLKA
jgi:regulator of replication initiation timing